MAKRYTHSTMITGELAGGCLGQGVTHTFVRGDTLAAGAHGNAIESDEPVTSLDPHGFVPAMSRCDIAENFDNNNCAQPIEDRRGANEIVKTFCLSPSLLLRCVAVGAALPVVAAGRTIRIYTIQRRGSAIFWRTGPSEGRSPLGREE
jgi:hypothetical protein